MVVVRWLIAFQISVNHFRLFWCLKVSVVIQFVQNQMTVDLIDSFNSDAVTNGVNLKLLSCIFLFKLFTYLLTNDVTLCNLFKELYISSSIMFTITLDWLNQGVITPWLNKVLISLIKCLSQIISIFCVQQCNSFKKVSPSHHKLLLFKLSNDRWIDRGFTIKPIFCIRILVNFLIVIFYKGFKCFALCIYPGQCNHRVTLIKTISDAYIIS